MITVKTGNLLEDDAEALVNTVNCVGAMGVGIAWEFKMRYPEMFQEYQAACNRLELLPGSGWTWLTGSMKPRYIINLSTKNHWRFASRYEWIEGCLEYLLESVRFFDIRSIAIPPLGCGHGRLDWKKVEPMILATAAKEPKVDWRIYGPKPQS